MTDRINQLAEDFWNIRGSFKLGGLVDIGTQSSLVRLRSGDFVLLDAYTLAGAVEEEVRRLTDGGARIVAILNLHPFHTVHCAPVHAQLPEAELFGTDRHARVLPELPWQALRTDDASLHERFSEDLAFTVPRGVDFIPSNERLHFSSVLAFHRASRILHVDDTLNYLRLPRLARALGWTDVLQFHPTLRQVLQKRAGAADEFRGWAEQLLEEWPEVNHLCAAHAATLSGNGSIHDRIRAALVATEGVLSAHARRYG